MERYGSLRDMDRSFDIEYWQRLGHAAIFRAAWELVERHRRAHRRDPHKLRSQRSIEILERLLGPRLTRPISPRTAAMFPPPSTRHKRPWSETLGTIQQKSPVGY
jgi:hypothetical protein